MWCIKFLKIPWWATRRKEQRQFKVSFGTELQKPEMCMTWHSRSARQKLAVDGEKWREELLSKTWEFDFNVYQDPRTWMSWWKWSASSMRIDCQINQNNKGYGHGAARNWNWKVKILKQTSHVNITRSTILDLNNTIPLLPQSCQTSTRNEDEC